MALSMAAWSQPLTNLESSSLHFGTSIYPFRKGNEVGWLVREARELGLTELRLGYERNLVERGSRFIDPQPQVLATLRSSGLDLILTLMGPGANERGQVVDFPRNSDGTIDGQAAAAGFQRYVEWVCQQTHSYVGSYELWNEAFNTISVRAWGKGFGPGASRQNAENYSKMMLPAAETIKRLAPESNLLVEGNYWNIPVANACDSYQSLLSLANFCVYHPYNYNPQAYQPGHFLADIQANLSQKHPTISWWYTEYGISPEALKLPVKQFTGTGQAKAYLRLTALHLSQGIQHLDPFALYYPSTPEYSFLEANTRQRRPVFEAMRRLIQAIQPKQPCPHHQLTRAGQLPANLRDLAISRPGGFCYLIWQEAPPEQMENSPSAQTTQIQLQSSTGKLKLKSVLDPISGAQVVAKAAPAAGSGLSLELDVPDYPLICEFESP